MNQSDTHLPVTSRRYALILARWHHEIVNQGRDSFLAEMERRGVPRANIDIFEVPGSFEIPLRAQALARSGRYAAVTACGFVVDGGIYRHDFVAAAVINGLMTVQLETGIPMMSVVLTPQHFHEHEDHRKFFREHFLIKGAEAASACLETVAGLDSMANSRQTA